MALDITPELGAAELPHFFTPGDDVIGGGGAVALVTESAVEIVKPLLAVVCGDEAAVDAGLELHGDGVPVVEAMAVDGEG